MGRIRERSLQMYNDFNIQKLLKLFKTPLYNDNSRAPESVNQLQENMNSSYSLFNSHDYDTWTHCKLLCSKCTNTLKIESKARMVTNRSWQCGFHSFGPEKSFVIIEPNHKQSSRFKKLVPTSCHLYKPSIQLQKTVTNLVF